eukprot:946532_1
MPVYYNTKDKSMALGLRQLRPGRGKELCKRCQSRNINQSCTYNMCSGCCNKFGRAKTCKSHKYNFDKRKRTDDSIGEQFGQFPQMGQENVPDIFMNDLARLTMPICNEVVDGRCPKRRKSKNLTESNVGCYPDREPLMSHIASPVQPIPHPRDVMNFALAQAPGLASFAPPTGSNNMRSGGTNLLSGVNLTANNMNLYMGGVSLPGSLAGAANAVAMNEGFCISQMDIPAQMYDTLQTGVAPPVNYQQHTNQAVNVPSPLPADCEFKRVRDSEFKHIPNSKSQYPHTQQYPWNFEPQHVSNIQRELELNVQQSDYKSRMQVQKQESRIPEAKHESGIQYSVPEVPSEPQGVPVPGPNFADVKPSEFSPRPGSMGASPSALEVQQPSSSLYTKTVSEFDQSSSFTDQFDALPNLPRQPRSRNTFGDLDNRSFGLNVTQGDVFEAFGFANGSNHGPHFSPGSALSSPGGIPALSPRFGGISLRSGSPDLIDLHQNLRIPDTLATFNEYGFGQFAKSAQNVWMGMKQGSQMGASIPTFMNQIPMSPVSRKSVLSPGAKTFESLAFLW